MNIGFDAKRAYHNSTGLGNYSRTLISSLAAFFPEESYYLFNPKPSPAYCFEQENVHEVLPGDLFSRAFPHIWRSSRVKEDLKKQNIHVYHGLSHEIPVGLKKTGIPSVVTIHDLIHARFPKQFNPLDVNIYNKKSRYACHNAGRIIAISKQTKEDIIGFFGIPEEKIAVCYQSCNSLFRHNVSQEHKKMIRAKYSLPTEFFLYVGSIIERKNLLGICKALVAMGNHAAMPLVVIGDGKEYKRRVKEHIAKSGLQHRVIFLSEHPAAKRSEDFKSGKDFPAIYQSAIALIYPSLFEGFGIPVLEALYSGLPVITSNVSSLPEAGGDAAYYVDPSEPEEIAMAMEKIATDSRLRLTMQEKGWAYAQGFSQQKCAASVMDVYRDLVEK